MTRARNANPVKASITVSARGRYSHSDVQQGETHNEPGRPRADQQDQGEGTKQAEEAVPPARVAQQPRHPVLLNSLGGRLVPRPRAGRPRAKELVLKVPSMHCQGCAGDIQEALRRIPGVAAVDADPRAKLVTVAVRNGVSRDDLCSAIIAIGHLCGEENTPATR